MDQDRLVKTRGDTRGREPSINKIKEMKEEYPDVKEDLDPKAP